jgi:type VI secretion system VasD/TssJ family lipoprotein
MVSSVPERETKRPDALPMQGAACVLRRQVPRAFTIAIVLAFFVSLAAGVHGCKKKDEGPSCVPEEKKWKVRVLVQPAESINPDEQGDSLATVIRIYQLSGDVALSTLDFRDAWQKGKDAFGDEFLAEEERTIYPGRPELVEIEPDPKATHIVAVAIFREPNGVSWYRTWEVPKYHGDSVCLAERQHKTWEDPCFYLLIDRNALDGGHTPPPGFDAKTGPLGTVKCPGPPLKIKPPPPPSKKDEKKKKKDLKKLKKLEKAKDAKAPEGPEAPEAPKGPEAPAEPGKG